jgi:hypothetical protein
MFKHVREHDDEGEEGETMKDHDGTLDEWEIAEEDRIGQDDKSQDSEGNQRDFPIGRCEGRIA